MEQNYKNIEKQKTQLWNTHKTLIKILKRGGDGNPYPSYLSSIRKIKVSRPWGRSCWVKAPATSSEMVRASSVKINATFFIHCFSLLSQGLYLFYCFVGWKIAMVYLEKYNFTSQVKETSRLFSKWYALICLVVK